MGLSSTFFGFVVSVLAGETLDSVIPFAFGVIVTAILAFRGFRISLLADDQEIVVRNHFRTYRLRWEDISAIGIGITSSFTLQVSAVVFRERAASHVVAAQATG